MTDQVQQYLVKRAVLIDSNKQWDGKAFHVYQLDLESAQGIESQNVELMQAPTTEVPLEGGFLTGSLITNQHGTRFKRERQQQAAAPPPQAQPAATTVPPQGLPPAQAQTPATPPPAPAAHPAAQPAVVPVTEDTRQRLIIRQSALKSAVDLLAVQANAGQIPGATENDALLLAEKFEAYVHTGDPRSRPLAAA